MLRSRCLCPATARSSCAARPSTLRTMRTASRCASRSVHRNSSCPQLERRRNMKAGVATVLGIIALAATPIASAQQWHRIGTNLIGYQEVPALSSAGSGEFDAMIGADDSTVTWELSYRGLVAVQQAHIHFGQLSVNGGISV